MWPFAVILQVVGGLILPQVAGIIPILHASKVSVQQAITQTGSNRTNSAKHGGSSSAAKERAIQADADLSEKYLPAKKPPGADTDHAQSGWRSFHFQFQCPGSLENYIDQVSNYLLADVNLDFARNYRINEIQKLALNIYGVQSIDREAMLLPTGHGFG